MDLRRKQEVFEEEGIAYCRFYVETEKGHGHNSAVMTIVIASR
jgi:hypothetical protein